MLAAARILSSHLLSANVKSGIYSIIIVPVLHGHETWSLVVREQEQPRMFQTRELNWIFGPKKQDDDEENCVKSGLKPTSHKRVKIKDVADWIWEVRK
jgi:hypothetical protein